MNRQGRPVRAVVAGELWHGSTLRGLADGLRSLGWLVSEVDAGQDFNAGSSPMQKVARRLMRGVNRAAYNRAIIDAARIADADYFVTVKGAFVEAATLATLKSSGVRTVNFYPDAAFNHPGLGIELVAAYDFVATTKRYQVEQLRALKNDGHVMLIQHGYAPQVHRPVSAAGDGCDIAYVGNASPYKVRWLASVAEAHPDRSIMIVGGGWRELAAGTALARHILGHALMGDACAWVFGAARINIALHWGPAAADGSEDCVSTRTFEIPACRGFMLHVDNAEVRQLFDVGTEIDVFDDSATLNHKIDRYLSSEEDRQRIAEAGYRRAVPAYSLDRRAAELAAFVTR